MKTLWDLGNVLVDWNPQGILAALDCSEQHRDTLRLQLLDHEDWQRLDCGTINEESVSRRLVEVCQLPVELVARCFELTRQRLVTLEPSVALLTEVTSRGIPAYCLSNMSHNTYAYLRDREFFTLFDGIVISAQEKLIKPDPAIFSLVIQRFELNPCDVLFIDDSLANIQAAEVIGMDTVHFLRSDACYGSIQNKLLG